MHHPLVTDTRSLLWVANQNCITPHVWTSRAPDLYQPDLCVFDLDPVGRGAGGPSRGRARAARPARRARIAELGEDVRLEGLSHRRAARRRGPASTRSRASRMRSARVLVKRDPGHLTQEFSKVDRAGRILVDTAATATVRRLPPLMRFAPARLRRSRRRARGQKLKAVTIVPQTFNLRTMAARVSEVGDLWKDMRRRGRSLRRAADRIRTL